MSKVTSSIILRRAQDMTMQHIQFAKTFRLEIGVVEHTLSRKMLHDGKAREDVTVVMLTLKYLPVACTCLHMYRRNNLDLLYTPSRRMFRISNIS